MQDTNAKRDDQVAMMFAVITGKTGNESRDQLLEKEAIKRDMDRAYQDEIRRG